MKLIRAETGWHPVSIARRNVNRDKSNSYHQKVYFRFNTIFSSYILFT